MKEITAYQVGQQVFSTVQEAQKKELLDLAQGDRPSSDPVPEEDQSWANFIVEHADEVIAILTDCPKAKAPRKPRKDAGKPRGPRKKDTQTPSALVPPT